MRKKKRKIIYKPLPTGGIPKQILRQQAAKNETVEEARERSRDKEEYLRQKGVLLSHASISSAYGVLHNMKEESSDGNKKGRNYLHITSIPMKS